jgi:2-keto-4-pentenoate hydratase/2-oxohepta-3-ene-1,7-dioic acid hydratase in catechol pathway
MRLVSFLGKDGISRLGAAIGEGVVDLSAAAQKSSGAGIAADMFPSMARFLQFGEMGMAAAEKLAAAYTASFMLAEVQLLPPVPRPGKIIAGGLNYRDHAAEAGVTALPKSPIIFAKFSTSISGHGDAIVLPSPDANTDYEAELAVVIGKKGKRISTANAYQHVAGYMPLNDVSARAWQFGDKQWVRGKSPDTFCPTGPWLTTRDEIADPHALAIRARVNGATMQDSNTSQLIFQIPELIEFISASITLEPGDIIATGTPAGVGVFRKPPIFLQPGDVVEVEIEKLGVLKNPVVAGAV